MGNIKLSICIPTYNNGGFIGETLGSIVGQTGIEEVEIIVGDGASTDNTAAVVELFKINFPNLTYCNFGIKGGVDLDIAKTVELARGDYCWLMSADDVFKPGVIRRILKELEFKHAIYLCNRTDCDLNLKEMANRYWLARNYGDSVFDFSNTTVLRTYLEAAQGLGAMFSFLSSIIVRREAWLSVPNNELLMNSNYAHVHRLFTIAQAGGKLKYLEEPLILARLFNDSFMADGLARRFLIDLDGYQLLAEQLFGEEEIHNAVKSLMRKEHKWIYLASLKNRVSMDEWGILEPKLSFYGYNPLHLYLANCLGGSNLLMTCARNLRNLLPRN